MERFDVDKISVYDYTEEFYTLRKEQIIAKFLDVCKNDNTLSEEFKDYISNIENINVKLQPTYGYDLYLNIDRLSVDYRYDYTTTYSTNERLSGEVKYNSSSNTFDTSNVHVVKDYHSYDSTYKGHTYFYATKYKKCEVHLGTTTYDKSNLKWYKNVKNDKNIPEPLKELSSRSFDYEDINKMLTISHLPEPVYNELHSDAMSYPIGSNRRNFGMTITDYNIENSAIIFCPSGCPFTITVKYKGKNYSTKFDKVNDITSMGETSTHYDTFTEDVNNALSEYSPKKWASNVIYLITCILSAFCALALFIMTVGCKAFGHEALKYQGYGSSAYYNDGFGLYKNQFTIFILILIVLFIVSIVKKCGKEEIRANNSLYDPSISSFALQNKIDSYYRKQRNDCVKRSIIYLVIISILCCGIMGYSSYIWKITDNPNYWYTPEIINTYSYKDDDLTSEWTIESCDKDGNVTATVYCRQYLKGGWGSGGRKGWFNAKVKYSGKITEKAYGKIVIEMIFVEMIEDPGFGSASKELTLEITNNYTELYDEDVTHTIKNS